MILVKYVNPFRPGNALRHIFQVILDLHKGCPQVVVL